MEKIFPCLFHIAFLINVIYNSIKRGRFFERILALESNLFRESRELIASTRRTKFLSSSVFKTAWKATAIICFIKVGADFGLTEVTRKRFRKNLRPSLRTVN